MSQHKALILDGVNVDWRVGDWPTPTPAKGEVLIKVLSAALNPVDWKIQRTGYFVSGYPAIVGSDGAGTIAQVGEDVTEFKVGDRVLHAGNFFDNNKGCLQQYALAPAFSIAKIPDHLSFDEAATIPLSLGTPAVGLYDSDATYGLGLTPPWVPEGLGKYKGKSFVVYGGSSSIGQSAIQLGKLSGFDPIVAINSPHHESLVRSLGATHFVDRHSSDIVGEVKAIVGAQGADFIFDGISLATTQKQSVEITKTEAGFVLVLPAAEGLDTGARKVVRTFGNLQLRVEVGTGLAKVLTEWLAKGLIKPNPLEVLQGGLSGVAAGELRLEKNQVSGLKLVAHPWD